jgi:hypothetical protein
VSIGGLANWTGERGYKAGFFVPQKIAEAIGKPGELNGIRK